MRSYIIFIILILIIALVGVINCQRGILDSRIRQRICNNKNSTLNLSGTLGTCASALAQEVVIIFFAFKNSNFSHLMIFRLQIQTVLTTCLTKQNKNVTPDDILSVMCANASLKQVRLSKFTAK
jgi:hypothetical protein